MHGDENETQQYQYQHYYRSNIAMTPGEKKRKGIEWFGSTCEMQLLQSQQCSFVDIQADAHETLSLLYVFICVTVCACICCETHDPPSQFH